MIIPWKKEKKKISDEPSWYLASYTKALGYKFVTVNGGITELGYKIYLSLLGVLGKTTMYNAPPRKSYIWFTSIDSLKESDLVRYDEIKYQYILTTSGSDMIKVLAKSLTNQGVPKI